MRGLCNMVYSETNWHFHMRPSCGGCFSEKLIVILQDGYLIQAYLEMETANFSEVLASQLTLKRCHHPDMEMQV